MCSSWAWCVLSAGRVRNKMLYGCNKYPKYYCTNVNNDPIDSAPAKHQIMILETQILVT